MQTTSLLSSGTSLAQQGDMGPLVLVSEADLKSLCQERHSDLGFLAGVFPERFRPLVSTAATGVAAGIAGAIDGCLGTQNTIGPVRINTVAAVVLAAGALFLPTTDMREGCATGARGFGAPLIYQWTQAKGAVWAAQQQDAGKTAIFAVACLLVRVMDLDA